MCLFIQDKKRADLKLKRSVELKEAENISSLLNDMLNNYRYDDTSGDEQTTMKELYNRCKSFQISISEYAADGQNDEILSK